MTTSSMKGIIAEIRQAVKREMEGEMKREMEGETERLMKLVTEPVTERVMEQVMKRVMKQVMERVMERTMMVSVMEPEMKREMKRVMEREMELEMELVMKRLIGTLSTQKDAPADWNVNTRTPLDYQIKKSEAVELQLLFANKLPDKIYTKDKIRDESDGFVKIKLIDQHASSSSPYESAYPPEIVQQNVTPRPPPSHVKTQLTLSNDNHQPLNKVTPYGINLK